MDSRLPAQPTRPAVPGVAPALDNLHRLAIALLRGVRVEDAAADVGAAAMSALSVLTFAGSLPLGALADAEGVRAPTMSRLVVSMERDGLVRRRTAPEDARSVLVEATSRGRSLILAGRARRLMRLQRAARALTPADLRSLARGLPSLEKLVVAMRSIPAPKTVKRRGRRRFD
ncbi:MAG: MarR family transcriptional regulator [Gemmatimonadota bacterium]